MSKYYVEFVICIILRVCSESHFLLPHRVLGSCWGDPNTQAHPYLTTLFAIIHHDDKQTTCSLHQQNQTGDSILTLFLSDEATCTHIVGMTKLLREHKYISVLNKYMQSREERHKPTKSVCRVLQRQGCGSMAGIEQIWVVQKGMCFSFWQFAFETI